MSVWKGGSGMQAELARVTAAGYRVVLSACWYLNYISYGEDWVKVCSNLACHFLCYTTYCCLSPTQYYQCDPHDFEGDETQKSLVMGGGAAVWGEFVDATNLIPTMW